MDAIRIGGTLFAAASCCCSFLHLLAITVCPRLDRPLHWTLAATWALGGVLLALGTRAP